MPTRRGARTRGAGASRRAGTRGRGRGRATRDRPHRPPRSGGGRADGRAGRRRARRCRRRAENETSDETEKQLPRDVEPTTCFRRVFRLAPRTARRAPATRHVVAPAPARRARLGPLGRRAAGGSVSDGATRRARDGPRWRRPCRAAPHPATGSGVARPPGRDPQAVFDVLRDPGRRAVRDRDAPARARDDRARDAPTRPRLAPSRPPVLPSSLQPPSSRPTRHARDDAPFFVRVAIKTSPPPPDAPAPSSPPPQLVNCGQVCRGWYDLAREVLLRDTAVSGRGRRFPARAKTPTTTPTRPRAPLVARGRTANAPRAAAAARGGDDDDIEGPSRSVRASDGTARARGRCPTTRRARGRVRRGVRRRRAGRARDRGAASATTARWTTPPRDPRISVGGSRKRRSRGTRSPACGRKGVHRAPRREAPGGEKEHRANRRDGRRRRASAENRLSRIL